jgi:hypothetical protein
MYMKPALDGKEVVGSREGQHRAEMTLRELVVLVTKTVARIALDVVDITSRGYVIVLIGTGDI